MSRLKPLFSLLAATLLIMAVAFIDGRPTVFYDSHSYDVMGRNLIEVLQQYPDSIHFKMKPGVGWGDFPVPTDRLIDSAVHGARSAYYGALLHASYKIGTLWLLAAVQSFLAAWVVYLLWRTMAPKSPLWTYLALTAGLVAGSSLSFFTTFAMPDIFAGIGAAAIILILTQYDRLRRVEVLGLWLLTTFSLLIHMSNLATGLGLAVVGSGLIAILGVRAPSVARRAALVLTAAFAAWFGGFVFDAAYKARTGYDLGHPPFMMARMLADGPGRAYMREACARGEPYALCRYQKNVGASTDLILWSDRPKYGVFNIADRATRIRLEKEEFRFVIGTILHDPVGQALASMENWGQQFVAFQVDDPLRNPAAYLRGRYWPTTTLPKLIPNFQACRPPNDCRPPFRRDSLAWWHGAVLALSLAFVLWRMAQRDVRDAVRARGLSTGSAPARMLAVVVLVMAVALINAAVCGILSGPFARYQARLAWLAPMAAGLVLCALPVRRLNVIEATRVMLSNLQRLWGRLQTQPVIGRFLPPLDGHFFRFCLVGALGFAVDASVLKGGMHFGLGFIAARAISFPVAVFSTWLANRTWTFRESTQHSKLKEASTYVAVQSTAGVANFAVYIGLIAGAPAMFHDREILALAAAAVAGLMINYLGSKHLVFRRREPASS